MLIDGNPNDEKLALEWVRQQKRDALRSRMAIKVEDGKLFHGYTVTDEQINKTTNLAHARRDFNSGRAFDDVAAQACFHPFAIRKYAAGIGVPTAEMYRNPELLQRMIKDRDYAKFRLNDRAATM
jgi:hypothetical protein